MKAKPHRRLPKTKRVVIHPAGLSPELLAHRIVKMQPLGAVTAHEMEGDIVGFIAEHYTGRHLGIEVAQLALSNVAHRLIVAYLKAVAR